jgi:lymphocyte antigen 6 complex protein
MDSYLLLFLTFLGLVASVCSLQCYTCAGDHWNWGSCTTNIEVCRPFQDACATYTEFILPTYFTPRGERHHSISKGCDTQEGCQRRQDALEAQTCSRTSFDDWACVECCTGDLCNYFVTLRASALHGNIVLLLALAATTMLFHLLHSRRTATI